MGYELPEDEKARLRKVENVLMIFFGGIILLAVFGIVYSRFRPLPAVRPGNAPRVAPQPDASAPAKDASGTAPTTRS